MKKFIARTLISLLLVSNMSFVVATHFCGGSAVSTEISLQEAKSSCAMDGGVQSCSAEEVPENNCCENAIASLDLDSDFTLFANPLPSAFALDLPAHSSFKLTAVAFKTISANYSAYSPPLPKQKRYISFQVFRI